MAHLSSGESSAGQSGANSPGKATPAYYDPSIASSFRIVTNEVVQFVWLPRVRRHSDPINRGGSYWREKSRFFRNTIALMATLESKKG